MSVASIKSAKASYDATRALGSTAVSSDFTLNIDGYENSYLLITQAPHMLLGPGEAIDVPDPGGLFHREPSQIKIAGDGQCTIKETVAGHAEDMLLDMLMSGKQFMFDCWLKDGADPNFYRYKWRYRHCFFIPEVTQRDWANRAEIFSRSGTLYFHYFGEREQGPLAGTGNGVTAGLTGFEGNR